MGRDVFTVALISSALTILLFLAPAALHRISDDDLPTRIKIAVRLSLAGSVTMAVAMSAALFVVLRFVYGYGTAVLLAGSTLAVLILLWCVFPITRRLVNAAS